MRLWGDPWKRGGGSWAGRKPRRGFCSPSPRSHRFPPPADDESPRPRCSDPTFTLFIYFFLFPPSPQSFSSLKIHRGLEFAGAALGEPVSFAAAPTWPLCASCPSVPPHRRPRRSPSSSKKKKPHKRDLVIYFIIFFFFNLNPSPPPHPKTKQRLPRISAELFFLLLPACLETW